MTSARIVLKDRRYGLDRKIVEEGVGEYRFMISDSHTGEIITNSLSATEVDARRIVRSTTKFLLRSAAAQTTL